MDITTDFTTTNLHNLVQDEYDRSVDSFIRNIEDYIKNAPEELKPLIRELEQVNAELFALLQDHLVEDLDYQGSFIPKYDWVSLVNSDEGLNIHHILHSLEALNRSGFIREFEVVHYTENVLIVNFEYPYKMHMNLEHFEKNYKELAKVADKFYYY